jgi:hypothetical protein
MPVLAELPVFRDSVMVHDVDLNALVANINNLYAVVMGAVGNTGTRPELALRVTNAARTCNRNTDVPVVWDVADVDTDTMWTSGSTITINTTGTYVLNAQVGTDGSAGDGMSLFIVINGLVTSSNAVACWREQRSYRGRCTATVSLVAGATITVILNHTAASNRHFSTTKGGCRFTAAYIGPA